MVKGYVLNNTGKTRHAYKRTVYPGQKVDLGYIYKQVSNKAPEGDLFVSWLKENLLPRGWEIVVEDKPEKASNKEVLTADITVTSGPVDLDTFYREVNKEEADEEDGRGSLEYITPKKIRELSSQQLADLRLKDNPERIIKQVMSVHKLRRALTLCKNNSRKNVLTRIIRHRIKELNATL